MYCDAHTHLNNDTLYPDRQDHLDTFWLMGGGILVNIGVNESYNARGIAIAKQSVGHSVNVKATVGIHPCEIVDGQCTIDTYIQDITHLESLYIENKEHIVGIGECGIDTYYPGSEETIVDQQKVFAAQCEFARKYTLPIIIHSRANRDATWVVMQHYPDLTRYMHCWTYTPCELDVLIQSGYDFYIGLTGVISYPKATRVRDSLLHLQSTVNLHRLVIETDAPYLPPVPHRGQTNVPVYIQHTYIYIADLLGISLDELQDICETNVRRLYDLGL